MFFRFLSIPSAVAQVLCPHGWNSPEAAVGRRKANLCRQIVLGHGAVTSGALNPAMFIACSGRIVD
jgi:hypothetical protein